MYYEFFGLREAPFKFLPSNTLFLSAAHLEGLAALEWAFNEPSGLTLLVGEVGTGKTMLIHSLIARMKDDRIRIAQLSNPTMSFEEMLATILQQLRINPAGKGKMAALQALKTFVSDPGSQDRVILIFDEAQGLSDETLEQIRLLSNSRPPQRHALQMILVGQPELVERLTDPKLRALNQRIGARALLRPLRGEEVHDYVNCLIRAQGARHELFTRRALDQVASLSAGLPRKINNLCHNALFHAYMERSPVVEPRHIQAASAELENLLDTRRDGRPRLQALRRGWHWLHRDKPLIAGALSAVAVAAVAMALELGAVGRGAPPHSRPLAHAQAADSRIGTAAKSAPAPHNSVNANRPPQPQSMAANSNLRPADAGRIVSAPVPANVTPAPAANPPTHPAPMAQSLASNPSTMGGTSIAIGNRFGPAASEAAAPIASAAPPSTERAPAHSRLSSAQERRLRYEIRRAQNSLELGRFMNAIYHARRALAIDPGNGEMRDVLARAQAGKSTPPTSAVRSNPVQPSDYGGTDVETPPPAPIAGSADKPFAGVVRDEIKAGDAYMKAGNYDMALRKFLTAAVLDPGNEDVNDRIARARQAKEATEDNGSDSAAESGSAP